jgi:hypothetical protein
MNTSTTKEYDDPFAREGARALFAWQEAVPALSALLGVLTAAKLARQQKVSEISAIEFGVAAGHGLLALQKEAKAVENDIGIHIKVYFDTGAISDLVLFVHVDPAFVVRLANIRLVWHFYSSDCAGWRVEII